MSTPDTTVGAKPLLTTTRAVQDPATRGNFGLDDHWVVNIEGRPNLTIDTRGSTSLEKAPLSTFADTESGPMDTVTAMTCVNAIPRVCAAVAGIVYPDTTNLPAVLWAHQQT